MISLPKSPISGPDMVGRSIRIVRLNWRPMLLFFGMQSFVYEWAYYFGSWFSANTKVPDAARLVSLVSITFLFLGARYDLLIRTYALYLSIYEGKDLFGEALSQARRKWLAILIAGLPTFLMEFTLLCLTVLSFWLTNTMPASVNPGNLHVIGTLFLLCIILIGSFPMGCIGLLNLTYMATFAAEKLSLGKGLVRFSQLLFHSLAYAALAVSLQTIVVNLLLIPPDLLTCLREISKLFDGLAKEIITGVTITVECCVIAPLLALVLAACAVASATMYSQLAMRFEGADVLRQLSKLRTE
jgi:hypothetical protein